jgi:alpha,alpha-trehalase
MLSIHPPDQIYTELFEAVQEGLLFEDSKTFVDALPKGDPAAILNAYRAQRDAPDFSLKRFVTTHFDIPEGAAEWPESAPRRSLRRHIDSLWDILRRDADVQHAHSSLIALPRAYIVPGGRFREIYYWDSYFTMLGLAASGRVELIQDMVDNFAWLIAQIGFIPNGNRTYYCTRSQPPLFAAMVKLLAEVRGEPGLVTSYLDALETEYRFWMSGEERALQAPDAYRRLVAVEAGLLNRYWDESDTPRQESHAEDRQIAEESAVDDSRLFREVRAACESGWDFSSRWLADPGSLASIRTTEIVPIDLNSMMFHLEATLAEACGLAGRRDDARAYAERAETRQAMLQDLFFDEGSGFFADLLLPNLDYTGIASLAGTFPLFFGAATQQQAEQVSRRVGANFLKAGGWVTTEIHSGQQWDAPNGWAPLQWIVYQGLRRYGFQEAAREGAERWVHNNIRVFERTGQLLEKYDVEEIGAYAGGGEYPVQHGFGWTNGVLVSLMDALDLG